MEHRVANWDEAGADWRKFKHAAMTVGTPPADGIAPASWADAEAHVTNTHTCKRRNSYRSFRRGVQKSLRVAPATTLTFCCPSDGTTDPTPAFPSLSERS